MVFDHPLLSLYIAEKRNSFDHVMIRSNTTGKFPSATKSDSGANRMPVRISCRRWQTTGVPATSAYGFMAECSS